MRCIVYACTHREAGTWGMLLPANSSPPGNWPHVAIRPVAIVESELHGVAGLEAIRSSGGRVPSRTLRLLQGHLYPDESATARHDQDPLDPSRAPR